MGAVLYLPFSHGRRPSGERFRIKFLLFVATVTLSDSLPSLGAIIERGFWLSLSGQDRGESNIQLMPVFGRTGYPEVALLHGESQVLVITVQISLCFVGIPSLLH